MRISGRGLKPMYNDDTMVRLLTPEERQQRDIANNARELAGILQRMEQDKIRADALKAFFEKLAEDAFRDTKLTSVDFGGTDGARVTVTATQTVKPISCELFRDLFGDMFADFVKAEVTFKLTEPAKRLLTAAFTGNYTESTVEALAESMTEDEKERKLLVKKLRGNYEKDKANIIAILGCGEQEASDNAYLAQEIINYNRLRSVIEASGYKDGFEGAVRLIKNSVIVDEGMKVTAV